MKRIESGAARRIGLVLKGLHQYNWSVQTLSDMLINAIEKGGWSRNELAARSGVDIAVISRLMSRKTEISVRNAHRIADAIGYEIRLVKARKKGG